MTSITFFFIFIPILAVVLLAINLIFAPHNPYQEKDSAFECGFHSFLGQNRTQFSISFFIFALLFLLFDLEILLVYPYVVSAYSNDIYGLVIMLIFFLALTLGFAFELGKNALKIDSRQTLTLFNKRNSSTTMISSIMANIFWRIKRLFYFWVFGVTFFNTIVLIYVSIFGPLSQDTVDLLRLVATTFIGLALIRDICGLLSPVISAFREFLSSLEKYKRPNTLINFIKDADETSKQANADKGSARGRGRGRGRGTARAAAQDIGLARGQASGSGVNRVLKPSEDPLKGIKFSSGRISKASEFAVYSIDPSTSTGSVMEAMQKHRLSQLPPLSDNEFERSVQLKDYEHAPLAQPFVDTSPASTTGRFNSQDLINEPFKEYRLPNESLAGHPVGRRPLPNEPRAEYIVPRLPIPGGQVMGYPLPSPTGQVMGYTLPTEPTLMHPVPSGAITRQLLGRESMPKPLLGRGPIMDPAKLQAMLQQTREDYPRIAALEQSKGNAQISRERINEAMADGGSQVITSTANEAPASIVDQAAAFRGQQVIDRLERRVAAPVRFDDRGRYLLRNIFVENQAIHPFFLQCEGLNKTWSDGSKHSYLNSMLPPVKGWPRGSIPNEILPLRENILHGLFTLSTDSANISSIKKYTDVPIDYFSRIRWISEKTGKPDIAGYTLRNFMKQYVIDTPEKLELFHIYLKGETSRLIELFRSASTSAEVVNTTEGKVTDIFMQIRQQAKSCRLGLDKLESISDNRMKIGWQSMGARDVEPEGFMKVKIALREAIGACETGLEDLKGGKDYQIMRVRLLQDNEKLIKALDNYHGGPNNVRGEDLDPYT